MFQFASGLRDALLELMGSVYGKKGRDSYLFIPSAVYRHSSYTMQSCPARLINKKVPFTLTFQRCTGYHIQVQYTVAFAQIRKEGAGRHSLPGSLVGMESDSYCEGRVFDSHTGSIFLCAFFLSPFRALKNIYLCNKKKNAFVCLCLPWCP